MRGSVYYQSSQLVKQIFQEGLKKEDKINPNHEYYKMVSSYKTMESYRRGHLYIKVPNATCDLKVA